MGKKLYFSPFSDNNLTIPAMQRSPILALGAFVLLLFATPVNAQLGFSFFPYAGYDAGQNGGGDGPLIGLGVEIPVTPSILPVAAKVRASAETTFLSEENFSVVRFNGDAVVRIAAPAVPVTPYGKAGVVVERISNSELDISNTEVGAGIGAGVIFSSLFVEGTLGLGDISDFRATVGYRF